MKRISHDLGGIMQRLDRIGERFAEKSEITQQSWRDAKGQQFLNQHASEVPPTINQLVATLQKTIELFEDIAKKVRDPKNS